MDFQYCPECEAFNPQGATHCEQCKAELPEVEEPTPAPAVPEAAPPVQETLGEAITAEAITAEPIGAPLQAQMPDAQPAEAPPFEAVPELLARVAQLEEQVATKPGANALYLQLSQLYLEGKRKDLAIRTLERCLERDPKNVYMRHRLTQLGGTAAAAPPPTVPDTQAAGAAPLAGGARPKLPTAKAAMATRPSWRPPAPRRRVSRWVLVGGIAGLLALALGVKLLFFPGPKLAVSGTFSAVAPRWSPTGRHFAFVMVEPSRTRLGVYDLRKGAQRGLAELSGSDTSAFAWSPDGKRIAYVGSAERGFGDVVFVVDVESGRAQRVIEGQRPAWAPDGTTLLMWCGMAAGELDEEPTVSDDPSQLPGPCQVDAGTGEVMRRSTESEDAGMRWGSVISPVLGKVAFERPAEEQPAASAPAPGGSLDGEFLDMVDSVAARRATNVYEGSRDLSRELQARARTRKRGDKGSSYAGDVYIADFEGGPEVRLTTDGRSGSPVWTPDGQRLLYVSDGGLWLMNADGSGRQQVFKGSPKLAEPPAAELSADGRYVLFVAPVEADAGIARIMTGEDPADLHVARVGSSTAKRLANRHPFKQRFALSPDGNWIVYEVLADTGSLVHGGGRSELWLMRR